MPECPNCIGSKVSPTAPAGEKSKPCYYCNGTGSVPEGHETAETWPLIRQHRTADHIPSASPMYCLRCMRDSIADWHVEREQYVCPHCEPAAFSTGEHPMMLDENGNRSIFDDVDG